MKKDIVKAKYFFPSHLVVVTTVVAVLLFATTLFGFLPLITAGVLGGKIASATFLKSLLIHFSLVAIQYPILTALSVATWGIFTAASSYLGLLTLQQALHTDTFIKINPNHNRRTWDRNERHENIYAPFLEGFKDDKGRFIISPQRIVRAVFDQILELLFRTVEYNGPVLVDGIPNYAKGALHILHQLIVVPTEPSRGPSDLLGSVLRSIFYDGPVKLMGKTSDDDYSALSPGNASKDLGRQQPPDAKHEIKKL